MESRIIIIVFASVWGCSVCWVLLLTWVTLQENILRVTKEIKVTLFFGDTDRVEEEGNEREWRRECENRQRSERNWKEKERERKKNEVGRWRRVTQIRREEIKGKKREKNVNVTLTKTSNKRFRKMYIYKTQDQRGCLKTPPTSFRETKQQQPKEKKVENQTRKKQKRKKSKRNKRRGSKKKRMKDRLIIK